MYVHEFQKLVFYNPGGTHLSMCLRALSLSCTCPNQANGRATKASALIALRTMTGSVGYFVRVVCTCKVPHINFVWKKCIVRNLKYKRTYTLPSDVLIKGVILIF